MNFFDLVQDSLALSSLSPTLRSFLPEIVLVATIVAMLVGRMVVGRRFNAYYVLLIGLVAALALTFTSLAVSAAGEIFDGMLVHDRFALILRQLLLVFTLLFAAMTQISGLPARASSTEFYVLVLGALLGMCLMVSANHMVIVFLGIEMASVPSYALAGFTKHRPKSTEAALKFAVFGGGAAGVMLYGISLLVGALGTAHLPTMADQLASHLHSEAGRVPYLLLVLGGLMLAVGLAFKLSAVPFHFWIPDVFEGATAEVAAFLSIASKAAALGLLVRLALAFSYGTPTAADASMLDNAPATAVAPAAVSVDPWTRVAGPSQFDLSTSGLAPVRPFVVGMLALVAAITCTFGNLAAYGQTNIKRLLAYSTIAHAGYMMMAVVAAVALAGRDPRAAQAAVAALLFYLAVYLFMNLVVFSGVAFLRNALASEEIDDYAGLVHRSGGLTVCMAIALFSLVGLPPLAGFAAKFTIFASVYDAGLLPLLVIGVANTVLSLFYYLRVVKVMVLDPEPLYRPTASLPLSSNSGLLTLVLSVPLVVLGVWWNPLFIAASQAASALFW